MDLLTYNNKKYPSFQSIGNASQFAIPYAKYFCQGVGYDIGCNRKEWAFPNSIPVDINFRDGNDAMNLPISGVDYIYSSHCLEHITNWVDVLEYWYNVLKYEGVLFLYLPDFSQEYWRPWNNRKHVNIFTIDIIKSWMISKNFKNIFYSGVDLNNSFMIVGEK